MAKNQGGDKQSRAEKLRVLFGKGILRSSGKRGKDGERKVTYHPEAGRTAQAKGRRSVVQRLRKSGAVGKVSRRYRNTPGPNSGRHVFGAKAAHLRGSGTGGKPKVDHSATRAERLDRAYSRLAQFAGKRTVAIENRSVTGSTASRRVMESKYPGTYRDTGQKFSAGTKIHYGDGPYGKGAYSRAAGRRDNVAKLEGDTKLLAVAQLVKPGRAHDERSVFASAAIGTLRGFGRDHTGTGRNVNGRLVVDRQVPGGLVGPGRKQAQLGKRVRDEARRLLKRVRAGDFG